MNPQPNRYGVSYLATPRNVDALNALVTGLGVAWARPPALMFGDMDSYIMRQARLLGLRVALTVRNTGNASDPSTPPDPILWRDWLQAVLSYNRPDLLVVENENNDYRWYVGTDEQYAQQLQVSCDVAHALGIPVTNGGITSDMAYRVYRYGQVKPLQIYRESTADYFNFHSYDQFMSAEIASYLAYVTGKPVISNEIGQRNEYPETTRRILDGVERAQLPIAIWYSGPGPACYPLWALDSFEPSPRYYAFQTHMRAMRLLPEVT